MPKYMVTYNQPGYLPESEPIYADSVEEAVEAIKDLVELEAEEDFDTTGLAERIRKLGGGFVGKFTTPEGVVYAVEVYRVLNEGGEI